LIFELFYRNFQFDRTNGTNMTLFVKFSRKEFVNRSTKSQADQFSPVAEQALYRSFHFPFSMHPLE